MDRLAWPKLGFRVRMNTHLSNLFILAVSNIERTGRTLDDEDCFVWCFPFGVVGR